MNAQDIYPGKWYAYTDSPTRGGPTPRCYKVLAISKRNAPPSNGEVKGKTLVTVKSIDSGNTREVNSRNLHCPWEIYQEEIDAKERKREAEEAEFIRKREEKQEKVTLFKQLLDSLGLPIADYRKVRITDRDVTIDREAFIEWIVSQSENPSEVSPEVRELSSSTQKIEQSLNPRTGMPYFRYVSVIPEG